MVLVGYDYGSGGAVLWGLGRVRACRALAKSWRRQLLGVFSLGYFNGGVLICFWGVVFEGYHHRRRGFRGIVVLKG
jgi:hypothetical protein